MSELAWLNCSEPTALFEPAEAPLDLPFDSLIIPRGSSALPGPVASDPALQGHLLSVWQMKCQPNPLTATLQFAKKTAISRDWELAREEYKYLKLHNMIEQAKSTNNWSFRQLAAHVAPPRPKSSHDLLLDEMASFN